MGKLQKDDHSRRATEIEPIAVDDLALIEEGLQPLGMRLATYGYSLDGFEVFGKGKSIVIEIKPNLSKEQLEEGLGYFDWVTQHTPWLRNTRLGKKISSKEPSQLLLIASKLDGVAKKIAKHLHAEIRSTQYQNLEFPDSSKMVIAFWIKAF